MITQTSAPKFVKDRLRAGETRLDIVVPYTTSHLTQVALDAAGRMGAGLNPLIRLIKVQVVPFPLDLQQTPVALEFIRKELSSLRTELPAAREVRLARDLSPGLRSSLNRNSLVIVAYRPRIWITPQEKLAGSLRKAGYHVVLVRADGSEKGETCLT